MNPNIRTALAELNRAFYAEFAGDFARTRQSWPPGFSGILPHLALAFNVLDLGCGNGRLLRFLHEQDWRGRYLGVDSSPRLLAIAEETTSALPGATAAFSLADLLRPDWPASLGDFRPDAVAALAVLHHIPGADARAAFVAAAADLLPPGGALILSTWQFLSSPRLRRHILPWTAASLAATDVEQDDYLLSWGQGAAGQRYCAAIDEAALHRLAAVAGLKTAGAFYADGHEGNLNLYGIYHKAA